jgi:Zn-dependent peptidase ImmA (M78 family)/DNA-binding XRE family transcriptional regulator
MTNGSGSKEGIIIGAQLQRARELLELTPEEVAQELTVNPGDIIDWEKGESKPNLKQLEYLANLYGREIDYFLRHTPTPPEKIEFRGKPGQSLRNLSREAKTVLARFDELCRTALEFERLLNKRRDVELPRFDEHDPPNEVARSLRTIFDVGDDPLPDLREYLEGQGVRILELPVPEDVFSGFSFWHPEYGPCILLDAEELKGRRNFTLANELAHLVYSHGSSLCFIPIKFSEPTGLESRANQFAVELLLPKPAVAEDFKKRELSRTPSQKELAPIAYYKWGVSIQALGFRLENIGLIEKGHMETLFETKPPYFRGKRGPRTPRWEKQLGKRFVETSIEAYRKGFISIGKLAHALQIPIEKAMDKVEQRER